MGNGEGDEEDGVVCVGYLSVFAVNDSEYYEL